MTTRLLDLVYGGREGLDGTLTWGSRTQPDRREVIECDQTHCETWVIWNLIAVPVPQLDRKQNKTGEDEADSCNLVLIQNHMLTIWPQLSRGMSHTQNQRHKSV